MREARLNSAGGLLLTTVLSVKEIATRVGYSHATDFNRQFKRAFSSTPTEWRRVRHDAPPCLICDLARIIHERCAFVHHAPAAGRFLVAAGFDTALRAVLKTAPGLVLSEGPRIGPESKPEGRTIRALHE